MKLEIFDYTFEIKFSKKDKQYLNEILKIRIDISKNLINRYEGVKRIRESCDKYGYPRPSLSDTVNFIDGVKPTL